MHDPLNEDTKKTQRTNVKIGPYILVEVEQEDTLVIGNTCLNKVRTL